MVYITGDLHGDLKRFDNSKLKKLKKNDTLIVCGDFGFIWNGSKKEQKLLKKLGNKKYNILFVEGCHENYNLLYNYPEVDYMQGKARHISGNLYQLIRGNIFIIENQSYFVFGGGQSLDIDYRKENNTFWKQELPTKEEMNFAINNLEKHNNTVDYIITHEPPITLNKYLDVSTDIFDTNHLNKKFASISEYVNFEKWFFGKCHLDKIISKKYIALFNKISVTNTKN